jgi:hypothetical protein
MEQNVEKGNKKNIRLQQGVELLGTPLPAVTVSSTVIDLPKVQRQMSQKKTWAKP